MDPFQALAGVTLSEERWRTQALRMDGYGLYLAGKITRLGAIMAERFSAQGSCTDCGQQSDMWAIVHDQMDIDLDETPCPISGCDGRVLWEEGERH